MASASQVVRSTSTRNLGAFQPNFHDLASHVPVFNTLTATGDFLRQELTADRLKSTQIVEEYQRAICKYNGYLNAVFELYPQALDRAQELDRMRAQGRILSPMHGIPVLLKVSNLTQSGAKKLTMI